VNGFITKVARFTVSKAATFAYAVAVGVAGNLIFHFVQPRDPGPTVIAVPPPVVQPAGKDAGGQAPAAFAVPKPAPAPGSETASPTPSPVVLAPASPVPAATSMPAATPMPVPKPAPALQFPERPTASLPDPATPPSPALKPAPPPGAPTPNEAGLKPDLLTPAEPPATVPSVVALPPLGPAIEVGTLPSPPERVAAPPMRPATAPPVQAAMPPPSRGLEFSDIWHPYRAVKKGLNWAGDQVPVIGGANEVRPTEPPPAILAPAPVSAVKPAPPAEPIPLLPTKQKPELADAPAAPAKPRPGPGSGGLY
jgi:hypothetical protein